MGVIRGKTPETITTTKTSRTKCATRDCKTSDYQPRPRPRPRPRRRSRRRRLIADVGSARTTCLSLIYTQHPGLNPAPLRTLPKKPFVQTTFKGVPHGTESVRMRSWQWDLASLKFGGLWLVGRTSHALCDVLVLRVPSSSSLADTLSFSSTQPLMNNQKTWVVFLGGRVIPLWHVLGRHTHI